jgi:hypothetical protein
MSISSNEVMAAFGIPPEVADQIMTGVEADRRYRAQRLTDFKESLRATVDHVNETLGPFGLMIAPEFIDTIRE